MDNVRGVYQVIEGQGTYLIYQVNVTPTTYAGAMRLPQKANWQQACNAEMASLHEFETFELCELPRGRKALGCRWVFTVKGDNTYKARLVVKGFSEVEGIDYKETFAPVIRHESVRILLGVAASMGSKIHQMDVKTAFLNGDLEEEIFMRQPEGYQDSARPTWVIPHVRTTDLKCATFNDLIRIISN